MKFKWTRYGLANDPRGAQVTFRYQGRELLGDVIDAYRHIHTGGIRLIVRHFNGELWPIEPSVLVVDVLDHTQEN